MPHQAASPAAQYHAGSLVYTTKQMLKVCAILLLAKHAFTLVTSCLVPQLKPILLDHAGANSTQIALIIGTIPSILNAILCPIISTVSDKTRTRWGRRTPYLLFSAPLVGVLTILIGFSGEIAAFITHICPALHGNVHLWVLGFLVCAFQIIFLFPASVICALEVDLIPKEVFGRYMAIVSCTSFAINAGFNYFLLEYAFSHTKIMLTLFSLFYVSIFFLQALVAKEGVYPPLNDKLSENGGGLRHAVEYFIMFFRQCFGRKIYFYLALCGGLNAASTICRSMYNMLFATKELGISYAVYGKIVGTSALVSTAMVYFLGKLMDKTHPMLLYFVGGLLVICVNVFGYFFAYGTVSYAIVSIVLTLSYAFQNLSVIPLMARIFPADKFGQYSSGHSMLTHVSLIIGSALGGIITEKLGYRIMFAWDFFITILATLALWVVYREWLRYGGKNYQPPEVE